MNEQKLSIETAMEQEAVNIADAFFSYFADPLQYSGENIRKTFEEFEDLKLDEQDIRWILDSASGDPREWGIFKDDNAVIIPFGEIEIQFEGKPEDFFEDPDDWHIKDDLAYCTMESVLIPVNLEELRDDLEDRVFNRLLEHIGILLSDARGVYIPRDFVDLLSPEEREFQEKENGIAPETWEDLSDPENENYWEAWQELEGSFVSENGTRIYQNGDLYEISLEMDKEPPEFVEIFWQRFVQ